MSYHPITQKLEASARAHIATATGGTVRGSEHDAIYEARSVRVTVESADGVVPIAGNADCRVIVEVRTMLNLYADFTQAVTDHYTLCGLAFDALMSDSLETELAATDLTIQGIKSGEDQTHKNENGTLVNTMSRVVRAVPQ